MKLRFLFLCVGALFLASSSNSFAAETGATKPVFLYTRYRHSIGSPSFLNEQTRLIGLRVIGISALSSSSIACGINSKCVFLLTYLLTVNP
jgi:hypothetical protein